jgi:acyl-ACP thioesterase
VTAGRPDGATELLDRPGHGRRFERARRVRLGDVDPAGELRLDATARYLQDIAGEDSLDGGLPGALHWVVRRTLVEIDDVLRFTEVVRCATWCQGSGPRWAERRTDIDGPRGTAVRAATLWVHIDPTSGGPVPLVPEFHAIWGDTATRQVRARLVHPGPPVGATARPWPLRRADLDALGHVNNAATWAAVEEVAVRRGLPRRVRASLEHPMAIEADDDVDLVDAELADGRLGVWLVRRDGAIRHGGSGDGAIEPDRAGAGTARATVLASALVTPLG